jgi:hypothetical protein
MTTMTSQRYSELVLQEIRSFIGWLPDEISDMVHEMQIRPAQMSNKNISYLSDPRNNGKRMAIRITRWLGKRLEFTYPEQEWYINEQRVEELAFRIQSLTEPVNFRIVSGKELMVKYRTGFGNGSCMTGTQKSKRADLYERNPDRVKMMTATRGNNQARALVWYFDNEVVGMDRVYTNSEALRRAMQEERVKRGWWDLYNGKDEHGNYIDHIDPTRRKGLFLSNLRVKWKQQHPYFDSLKIKYGKFDVNKHEVVGLITYRKMAGRVPTGYQPLRDMRLFVCDDKDCLHSYTGASYDKMTNIDGLGRLCPKCVKKLVLSKCDWCKKKIPERAVIMAKGLICCQYCYHEYYNQCRNCGEITEARHLDFARLCPPCHTQKYRNFKVPRPRRLRGKSNA